MSQIEPPSDWDFNSVINVLPSPACRRSGSPTPPLSESSPGKNVNSSMDYPRLGDFGSLWGLMGEPATSKNAEALCQDATSPPQPPQPPKPITILKRPQPNNNDTGQLATIPPPSRAIPVPGIPQSRSFYDAGKAQTDRKTCNSGNNKLSSEANFSQSPEVDSDGDSIFDTPILKESVPASMVPPQVGIPAAKSSSFDTPPSSYDSVESALGPEVTKSVPKSNHGSIRPRTYTSASDQRIGLLTKLLKGFPDYVDVVVQVGRPVEKKAGGSSPRPIHVFVDMSNIMFGFRELAKTSRCIPISTRIPNLDLSFENFSLVLERGRRATKRVLAGSDRFRGIDEAKKMGYETNILDRVQKGRYLAQRRFKLRKQGLDSREALGGSETNDAAEQWVEQGVDEILHLKMLESLVDTDEPTTIVLATGDAAKAEYSDGFMKMVGRALERGWTVELVSFSRTTSSAYRKKKFRQKWGDQFQMITLDDYVEELLSM